MSGEPNSDSDDSISSHIPEMTVVEDPSIVALVEAMKRIVDEPKMRELPEREVADFIVRMSERGGEGNVEDFITRALSDDFALTQGEKLLLDKTAKSLEPTTEPLRRRRFNSLLAQVGGLVGIGAIAVSGNLTTALQGFKNDPAKRQQNIKALVDKVQSHPLPPATTTVEQQDNFYKEVDLELRKMELMAAPERLLIQKFAGLIGAICVVLYGNGSKRRAEHSLEEVYDAAAQYIAHKASHFVETHKAAEAATQR